MCGQLQDYMNSLQGKAGDDGEGEDDKEETVLKRIGVYEAETAPLIDYYNQFGLVLNIDGNQPLEEVRDQIFRGLDNLK